MKGMTEIINILAEHLNSSVFILLVVLVASYWAVHKVSYLIARWKHKEEDMDSLKRRWDDDIPNIKASIDLISQRLDLIFQKWDDDIPKMKASIDLTSQRMDMIFQKLYPHATVQISSPTKLTETGKVISKALHAEEFIERFYQTLSSSVKKSNPRNAYDLQQACFSVVAREIEGLLSEEQVEIAKDKSFEYGLPLDHTLAIFAVLLRDHLMKEKEWTNRNAGSSSDPNHTEAPNPL